MNRKLITYLNDDKKSRSSACFSGERRKAPSRMGDTLADEPVVPVGKNLIVSVTGKYQIFGA